MKTNKYTIQDLKNQFPTDEVCAEYIFDSLHSRKCSCGGEYKQLKGRRQFQCSKCRYQVAPTVNTIFHKSPTPLTLWFHALFVFSTSKSGLSAKNLESQIGVTYKCAWRMLNQIKKALKQSGDKLKGVVETDAGYFGGVKNAGRNNENLSESMRAKAVVLIAVERNGNIKAKISENATADSLEKFVRDSVEEKAILLSDNARGFNRLNKNYRHFSVNHSKGEYVRYKTHVNTVETFISHLKRSIGGTFKSVSKKHLQSYLDAFVFHYNNRHNDRERFSSLLGAVLQS
ncbi:MAG: IS1595 family transposase [Candidatus Paceibacterota bacterium]